MAPHEHQTYDLTIVHTAPLPLDMGTTTKAAQLASAWVATIAHRQTLCAVLIKIDYLRLISSYGFTNLQ